MSTPQIERIQTRCLDLRLRTIAQLCVAEAEQASTHNLTYLDYLDGLLDQEVADKQHRTLVLKTRLARFPYHKTLADFDFSAQPSIDERKVNDLVSLRFLEAAENVIFLGPPGVGKTHLAIALGLAAITHGATVAFTTLQALLTALHRALHENRLEDRLTLYLHPKLLILDEIGYLPLDTREANFLFQLISGRYEKGSIILTSNKSYGDWGSLFGERVIASAILDRLLHHSHTINIKGESYRLKEKRRAGTVPHPIVLPRKEEHDNDHVELHPPREG